MSMHTPLVTIILPVYNGELYLQETLDSIREQDYRNLELIAVNDGSTDQSLDILTDAQPDILLNVDNGGVAKARNIALQNASGEYICFIDQDDLWHRDKTAVQVNAMMADPTHMYGICQQQYFVSEGDILPAWCKQRWLDEPQEGLLPSALIIRQKFAKKFGLFDESMPVTSDIDMFFRLRDKSVPFFNIQKPLLRRRVHKFNQSSDTKMIRSEILRTIRETMIRRRKIQQN
jgi:glycosyltransferase involved in cell wall biosynthesis